ncbi:MAG: hypothetical protein KBS62_04440 [Oscillospiraceae bacterium]|nr:hypothetical protein [Candidatus Ruminococcus equi]
MLTALVCLGMLVVIWLIELVFKILLLPFQIIGKVAENAENKRLRKQGYERVKDVRYIRHTYNDGLGKWTVDEKREEDYIVPIDRDN